MFHIFFPFLMKWLKIRFFWLAEEITIERIQRRIRLWLTIIADYHFKQFLIPGRIARHEIVFSDCVGETEGVTWQLGVFHLQVSSSLEVHVAAPRDNTSLGQHANLIIIWLWTYSMSSCKYGWTIRKAVCLFRWRFGFSSRKSREFKSSH